MDVYVSAVEALSGLTHDLLTPEIITRIADLSGKDWLNRRDTAVATLQTFLS
jgi:hypothetical protein